MLTWLASVLKIHSNDSALLSNPSGSKSIEHSLRCRWLEKQRGSDLNQLSQTANSFTAAESINSNTARTSPTKKSLQHSFFVHVIMLKRSPVMLALGTCISFSSPSLLPAKETKSQTIFGDCKNTSTGVEVFAIQQSSKLSLPHQRICSPLCNE